MNVRAICEGRFNLPLSIAATVPLFTPEGERRWAGPSWDPVYAIPDAAADDAAPGTVFTTESGDGNAIWIVLERRADGMRYARMSPDRIAGTISVTCARSPAQDETEVAVTYDVTSLGPAGVAFVEELQAGYDDFLASWREEILDGLAGSHAADRPAEASIPTAGDGP